MARRDTLPDWLSDELILGELAERELRERGLLVEEEEPPPPPLTLKELTRLWRSRLLAYRERSIPSQVDTRQVRQRCCWPLAYWAGRREPAGRWYGLADCWPYLWVLAVFTWAFTS